MKTVERSDRGTVIRTIQELAASSGPYVAFCVRGDPGLGDPINAELIHPLLPSLKMVSCASKGYDDLDVDYMTRRGLWVSNSVNSTTGPTSEMTMTLILALVKNIFKGDKSTREGNWRKGLVPAKEVAGLTLGIIGMGSIGQVT